MRRDNQRGAGLTEYGLVVALIFIVSVAGVRRLGWENVAQLCKTAVLNSSGAAPAGGTTSGTGWGYCCMFNGMVRDPATGRLGASYVARCVEFTGSMRQGCNPQYQVHCAAAAANPNRPPPQENQAPGRPEV